MDATGTVICLEILVFVFVLSVAIRYCFEEIALLFGLLLIPVSILFLLLGAWKAAELDVCLLASFMPWIQGSIKEFLWVFECLGMVAITFLSAYRSAQFLTPWQEDRNNTLFCVWLLILLILGLWQAVEWTVVCWRFFA